MTDKVKILVLGPLEYKNKIDSFGGASILFKEMLDYLQVNEYDFITVPSNKYKSKFFSFIYITYKILIHSDCRVAILNLSQKGITFLLPLIFFILKGLNFKIHLRFFGAHAHDLINKSILKNFLNYILKSSEILFVETMFLVNVFQKKDINVKLFPNVRKLNTLSSSDFNHQKKFNKRFLFIGQIKRSKGIVELIKVFDELGADYSLEIYGMIKEKELDFIKTNSNYKGSINHSETDAVYRNNDVLVLPTYYEGEGYPGAIIEAFANSLPVITTNWMSIPEIVNDNINGILIKPMSKKELKEAILSFDNYNYKKMSKNSYSKSKEFDTNKVHDRIFSEILFSQHLY